MATIYFKVGRGWNGEFFFDLYGSLRGSLGGLGVFLGRWAFSSLGLFGRGLALCLGRFLFIVG